MRRTLAVKRALELFHELQGDFGSASSPSSEAESDDAVDDGVNDPLFVVVDNESDHEQPGPSTVQTPRRTTQRGRGRRIQFRSAHAQPHQSSEPWKTENDPDITPQISRFMPHRPPGAQVNPHAAHSPIDLFKLYFSMDTMRTLCKNTNTYAAKRQEMGEEVHMG
ncbi:uncharacterized protein AKAME5_002212300 [Lates japonicus]|uniref:PiggyBac transposable element-derived protein domain-containing protein n=1 Tax=Lates japonicus TaxID=270547 RepID=A0AAD3NGP9_LATJO|nr:uncharacterized protein AKAME5_002212300 [Lates japonicus]